MKKPRVQSSGSGRPARSARIASEHELKEVIGGDGVTGQRLPQLQQTPSVGD